MLENQQCAGQVYLKVGKGHESDDVAENFLQIK